MFCWTLLTLLAFTTAIAFTEILVQSDLVERLQNSPMKDVRALTKEQFSRKVEAEKERQLMFSDPDYKLAETC